MLSKIESFTDCNFSFEIFLFVKYISSQPLSINQNYYFRKTRSSYLGNSFTYLQYYEDFITKLKSLAEKREPKRVRIRSWGSSDNLSDKAMVQFNKKFKTIALLLHSTNPFRRKRGQCIYLLFCTFERVICFCLIDCFLEHTRIA